MAKALDQFGFQEDGPKKLDEFGFKEDATTQEAAPSPSAPKTVAEQAQTSYIRPSDNTEIQTAQPDAEMRSQGFIPTAEHKQGLDITDPNFQWAGGQTQAEPAAPADPAFASRSAQALYQGATTLPRLAEKAITGKNEYIKNYPLQNMTSTEEAIDFAGSFADPVALASGAAIGKVVGKLLPYVSGLEAESTRLAKVFAGEQTEKASEALYKATMRAAIEKTAVEGAVFTGTVAGVEEFGKGNRDLLDIAKKSLTSAGAGALLGGALGAGIAKFGGKPKFTASDVAPIVDSPAISAINEDLNKAMAEHSRLSEKEAGLLDLAKQDTVDRAETIAEKMAKAKSYEANKVDAAAQAAANAEFNHQQELERISKRQSSVADRIEAIHTDPSDLIRVGEQQSKLDAKRLALKTELEQIRSSDAPLEERFSNIDRLEGQLSEVDQAHNELRSNLDVNTKTLKTAPLESQISQLDYLKTKSFIAKDQKLADISSELNQHLESLNTQRQDIVNKVLEKPTDVESLLGTRSKLQDLNGRMSQLKEAADGLKYEVAVPRKGSTYDRNLFRKEAQSLAYAQAEKVRAAGKAGLIPEAQVTALAKAEFDNALNLQGVNIERGSVFNFGDLFGKQVDFNHMGEKLGVKTGEVWNELLFGRSAAKNYASEFQGKVSTLADNLNKLGMTDEQITYSLQYIEDKGFNPNPVQGEKLSRGAYQGVPPSPEALQQLGTLRQLFNEARQQATATGLKVGHIEGYVPLMQKGSAPVAGGSLDATMAPRFSQARQAGYLDPTTMETNIREIGKRYGAQVGKAAYLKAPFEQGIAEINKLRLMGRLDESERFSDNLLRALNIKDKKAAAQVFGENLIDANMDHLTNLASMTDNPQGFLAEIYAESSKLMHSTLVTSNPASMLKQALHPDFLGPAELGPINVQVSRALALGPQTALKERAEGLLKYVLTDNLVDMTEMNAQKPNSLVGKAINLVGLPLRPGSAIFGKVERLNRLTSLIGGIRMFEGAVAKGTVDSVMNGLSSSEKGRLTQVIKTQGNEAAANLFAMIKSSRVNFLYDSVNKPEILQNMLGKMIPFTGFARGFADQLASGLLSKDYRQVAKKVAYPLVSLAIIKGITGNEVTGTNPTEAPLGLLNPKIAPQITEPIKVLAKTKSFKSAGEELLKYTPVGTAERILKAKSAGELLGIKDKAPGYINQLSKDLGNK